MSISFGQSITPNTSVVIGDGVAFTTSVSTGQSILPPPPPGEDFLLLEDGDIVLLQDDFGVLLE